MTIRYHVQATNKGAVVLSSTSVIDGWMQNSKQSPGSGYKEASVCHKEFSIDDAKNYMLSAKDSGEKIERGEDQS
jgi:hypothetical protein